VQRETTSRSLCGLVCPSAQVRTQTGHVAERFLLPNQLSQEVEVHVSGGTLPHRAVPSPSPSCSTCGSQAGGTMCMGAREQREMCLLLFL
jgi:hypothetical protein